jgi:hypothetical protein
MKKQTAVESFWNKIALKLSFEQLNEFIPEFNKAKEIEKEQIVDAHLDGYRSHPYLSEQYYNETYADK